MVEPKKVKVGIQITHEEGGRFPREWLWAQIVREDAAGGIYCLLNTAFYGPFALGDLVEARRRRNGELTVSGLHRRGGRTSWLFCSRQNGRCPTDRRRDHRALQDRGGADRDAPRRPGGHPDHPVFRQLVA